MTGSCPFIVASQLVPKVALIPLFVVWFGYGPEPKLLVVTVMAFFPVFTSSVLGLGQGAAETSIKKARLTRMTRRSRSAAPYTERRLSCWRRCMVLLCAQRHNFLSV